MKLELKWNAKDFLKDFNGKMDKELDESRKVLVDNIKQNTPVITGTLRDSITGFVDTKDNSVTVGTDVYYAKFVEFGTRYFSPRFFMSKGYKKSLSRIKEIFSKDVE